MSKKHRFCQRKVNESLRPVSPVKLDKAILLEIAKEGLELRRLITEKTAPKTFEDSNSYDKGHNSSSRRRHPSPTLH